MFQALLLQPLTIIMSLSAATGVFVHDMRIDRFASTALALPAVIASYQVNAKLVNFATDMHTHVERVSLAQSVADLRTQNPQIQPRLSDGKKYLSQRYAVKGQHIFDNYNLPIR